MKRIDRISPMHGVCLVELVIGMAMAILALGAMFGVLHFVQSTVGGQYQTMDQQQDLRLGLEVFEQEVRLATADSFVSANQHDLEFFANVHALRTNTTAAVLPGQSVLPVIDGSGWGNGKMVEICGPLVCETHRLSRAGQRNVLTLDDQVRKSFSTGASVALNNQVRYYTKEDEKGTMSLMRMVDGGANVLIAEVETVMFSYRDKKGRMTNLPSDVARVLVEIQARYKWTREARSVALRS